MLCLLVGTRDSIQLCLRQGGGTSKKLLVVYNWNFYLNFRTEPYGL